MKIYVLLLKSGKYYVGKSSCVNKRILSHFGNCGSEWTKLYPPVKVVEILPFNNPSDEDNITLKYMASKGKDNVRGGSYCQLVLPDLLDHTTNATREARNNKDLCFKCGSPNHWVKNCPNSKQKIENKCVRCGRLGHTEAQCYAKTHVGTGKELVDITATCTIL